jgi:glycosyltransferase involved in cell wall biosynthesis
LDVGAITAALRRLLDDGRRRDELIALGRAREREFSWDRCAAATLAVYEWVLGAAGDRGDRR